jgi:hypothetical protein
MTAGRMMSAPDDLQLSGIQAAFAASLMGQDQSVPRALRRSKGAVTLKRFNVHRNNVFAGLAEALRTRFPVVARLVGEAFFWATAVRFAHSHPPLSPALLEYGAGFPDFLARFEPAQSLPYLPDVARLEWLRHAAYHAPDAEPMALARLADVPANRLERVMLCVHPSAGLLVSIYPAFSIWHTNATDAEVRLIGPETGGEAILVVRPRLEVSVILLPPGGGEFIGAIAEGAPVAVAAEKAAAHTRGFALAETLGICLAAEAFTGLALEGGLI